MDLSRIRAAVDQLDREVPTEPASVLLEQYGGGPDESRIVATRAGLLRLGVEVLRSGVQDRPESIDLRALLHSNSDIGFDSVEVRERLEEEKRSPVRGKFIGFLLFAVALVVIALAVYGAVSLARSLLE